MTRLLLLALTATLMFSCNDDDIPEPVIEPDPPVFVSEIEAWMPLSVGSYWIYQRFQENEQGEFEPTSDIDSVYIVGDTLIDGLTYVMYEGSSYGPHADDLLRISNDLLVNNNGEILFTDNPEMPELSPATYGSSSMVVATSENFMVGDTLLNFEIGQLNSKYAKQEITWEPGISDCTIHGWHYWGKNIGPVRRDIYYASNCERTRLELIRYHIE